MKFFQIKLKRVPITLFMFLFACSTPYKPHWVIEKVVTDSPCFNSGKLTLTPEDTFCGLELELTRGECGLRMYINVYSLEIKPETSMQNTALVEVMYQNEKKVFQAFLYQGGQRLLLPNQAKEWIIELLCKDESLTISVGRYRSEINPHDFICKYQTLLNLPIN